jgi:hypothetical protein
MEPHFNYVPCLKWKLGEYQALLRMPLALKEKLLPVLEVAEFFVDSPHSAYDFEDGKPPKSIDQHLLKVAERIEKKWGVATCLVDLRRVDARARLRGGIHAATYVFEGLRSRRVHAVPVIGLDPDAASQVAIRNIVKTDQGGLGLRCRLDAVSRADIVAKVKAMITAMDLEPAQCHLILDIGAPDNFEPLDALAAILETGLQRIPYLDRWQSLAIIGTSLPASVRGLGAGMTVLPRQEWRLYKRLRRRLERSGLRVPMFGDYGVDHPSSLNLDMRFIYPKAAIRYSTPDGWLVARGDAIRGPKGVGLGQFMQLCDLLAKSSHYSGPAFSSGDAYIGDCALGRVKPGNPTRFREVGTSHHIARVQTDLSSLGVG